MADQSQELTEFYQSYLIWLEEGAPEEPFARDEGLCWCLGYFAHHCGYDAIKLEAEFKAQLMKAGLFYWYPFNANGLEFSNERAAKRIHLNPKRIQWVKDHAQG